MTKSINLQSYMRARVDQMNEAHLDPTQRAELVNTFIQKALGLNEVVQPDYWDLICYSAKMLQLYAISNSDVDEGRLKKLIDLVVGAIESIHYSGAIGEDSFLGPTREEHEGIWVDRIERFGVKECVDPKWDEATRVHDWRNYISDEVKANWTDLGSLGRWAVTFEAKRVADNEEWN